MTFLPRYALPISTDGLPSASQCLDRQPVEAVVRRDERAKRPDTLNRKDQAALIYETAAPYNARYTAKCSAMRCTYCRDSDSVMSSRNMSGSRPPASSQRAALEGPPL